MIYLSNGWSAFINNTIFKVLICEFVEFGINYDSDIKKAKEIIRELAEAHPLCIDHRTAAEKKLPIVEVRLMNFGDFTITLRALIWVRNAADRRKKNRPLGSKQWF